MKRIIAMMLALVMVFALCGCGSETSDNVTETAKISDATPKFAEAGTGFAVEDFKYERTDSHGNIFFKLKLRNNTSKDFPEFHFEFQALDKNGDILMSLLNVRRNIQAGQAMWVDCTIPEGKYVELPCFVQVISVTEKSRGDDEMLEEIIQFPLNLEDADDIEAEESQDYDRIEVEGIFVKRSSSNRIAVKVRNNDDAAHEIISLNVQILDSNGDLLESVEPCVFNLDVGQAGKTEYLKIKSDFEEIASVKIIGYRFGTGSDLVRHFSADGKFNLTTPIIMSVGEITKE